MYKKKTKKSSFLIVILKKHEADRFLNDRAERHDF